MAVVFLKQIGTNYNKLQLIIFETNWLELLQIATNVFLKLIGTNCNKLQLMFLKQIGTNYSKLQLVF